MGLLDILSNPQMIGMAMAGLSRDREAPMNAMRSIGMVEDINRRREEDARRQQAQVANTGLLQALMQAQAAEGQTMEQAMQDYGQIRTMPSTSQAFMPDQQAGSAVDYETGQAYQPTQVPNQNKAALVQNFYNTLAKRFSRPEIDFSQFQGASPEMMLAVMKQRFENKPADRMMEMIEKREKPITLKEGDTLLDPQTYQPISGTPKPQSLDRLKAEYINDPTNPKWANLTPEQKRVLGVSPQNERQLNMQPSYDLVGTELLGAAYRTEEGQKKFADMYASDPRIQQAVTAVQREEAGAKFQGFPPQVIYLQTDQGFVPMPSRGPGVGNLPMGKPIEGLGKPIPSEQMSRLADLDTLEKQIADTRKTFKSEYVGPVGGRVGTLKEKIVDIPPDQVKFYATVKDMKDSLLRARSGAQINEQEYKRLSAFVPDENLPAGNFAARLARFETAVKQVAASKRSELAGGGYGTPQKAPITQIPQTNTQPKTIRYNAQGQRIQ